MTTEYPSAPKHPGREPGLPEHIKEMLGCLSKEEQCTVLESSISLESAVITGVKEVFILAYNDAEEHGTHLLGHSLQAGVAASENMMTREHGAAEMITFTPAPCDDPEHQLAHEFVTEFVNDVINRRYDDSMARWREFLSDCQENYLAYVNGIYGVCQASIGVALVPPVRTEIPEFGSVLQIGPARQE
jgi:hypothetical protein